MERLGDSLRGALRQAGAPDMGALTEITRAWPAAVGDGIARSAWPQRVGRDGTLHVATISSAWAFELGLLAEEIIGKLRAAVGKSAPASITFTPGPIPAPPAALAEVAVAPLSVDAETRRLAEELTAAMSDAELRETIARAAAASLARAASDRGF
jgi:hypothetical protein